jgi:outer membrane protein assembly factor BamB
MRMNFPAFVGKPGLVLAGACLLAGTGFPPDATAGNWPGFRGSAQAHTDAAARLPVRWSADTAPAWETTLPGTGQSSPVIWDGRVLVTAIDGANKETLHLLCVELATGKELWRKTWESSFTEKDSEYVSKAAPTPAVDGERVYVLFESGDLIALTHGGEEIWRRELTKDFGKFEGNHGQGSSPVLTPRGVVVLVDHKGQSFIASFDQASGRTQWKTDRETTSAWSTPLVLERAGRTEVIASASGSVTAYHPDDGSVLWTHEGLEGNNVPSPATDGSIFLVGSRKKGANVALREAGGKTEVAWQANDATSAFGSPLVHDGRAYFASDAGVAYCYRLNTGELLWDARIADATWASPLAAGPRIYFFGKNGKTTIVKAADEFVVEAECEIPVDSKDRVYGYAVSEGRIVFRLGGKLVCLTK